jgi:Protein of unknown function (DUF3800)
VYILYIDESGDGGTNPGSSRHLVLAGVAIHEGQWRGLTRKLDSIQDSQFPQAGSPIEFHASEIRSGRNIFRSLIPHKRATLMSDVYGVISQVTGQKVVLFSAVIEKSVLQKKYGGMVQPYEQAFEGLCTMFNFFLRKVQAKQGSVQRGIIVFDEARPSLSRQIRTLLAKFQAGGSRWTTINSLVETVFFFDSRTSRIMQLADFTAHAVYRWYEAGDPQYLKLIHHKFDREGRKVHGIKCYPLESTKSFP